MVAPRQGELWWYEMPDEKRRPVLVVGRDVTAAEQVVVAPVTRTVRGLPSEVPVGPDEGLPTESVASFDHLRTARKSHLTDRLGVLGVDGLDRICAALDAMARCP